MSLAFLTKAADDFGFNTKLNFWNIILIMAL